ncbi:MAG: hypothetical protein WAK45_08255 [Methanoregula sp.]|uniref:hypothetical protein n=1 Tax=Methanoregula sp. TaxID=2052170 RepID=UPI003BB0743A
MTFIFKSMSKEMVIAEAARVMLAIEKNTSMSLIIEPCPDSDREGWWQVRECPIFPIPRYKSKPHRKSERKVWRDVGRPRLRPTV